MCGIAGFACDGSNANDGGREAVARMLAAERHRGPDGDGIWQDGAVVLGHRRLSIIDLSAAGAQPMANEDGALRITYNGEIYNHRELRAELSSAGHQFQSRTDTEVLLHGYEQWGMEGLLGRLRGMFAFAIYDSRRGLLLARDRLGIKPLYYYAGHAGAGFLAFASEVKALLRSGLVREEHDRSALAGFLMVGAVPAPLTYIRNVQCLPAGHWAEWKGGEFKVRKYWDLTVSKAEPVSIEELQTTLADAVERHLISDVPLGVFLSGGVDSAGLVALASRARRDGGDSLRTLTVVFDEKEFSEAGDAAEMAKRFGAAHREVRVTSADFQREWPAFMAAMDQPTNDGVNSYFVSKAAREAGLTVVLSGLGGDEVFWGYKHYRWLRYGRVAEQCPAALRQAAAGAASAWGRIRGRENWKRTAWLKPAASSERLYLTMRGFFAPDQVARLMDMTEAETNAAVEEHFGRMGADSHGSANGFNYIEMKRYLHDQLLRDTDVFSMAHSIEARVPYLDHVLVERLWNTPAAMKLDKAMNKPLLVRAVGDDAVRQAGERPKRGFTFPMARWMQGAAAEMQEVAETGELVRSAVRECWGDFAQGRLHWSRAWALTVLGARAA